MKIDDEYHLMINAEVWPRDGLGVELYRTGADEVLAEVFRDDASGDVAVRVFRAEPVSYSAIVQLLDVARRELGLPADACPSGDVPGGGGD